MKQQPYAFYRAGDLDPRAGRSRSLPAQTHATPLITPSTIPYPKDVKSCQLIFKPAVTINIARAANL